MAPLGESSDTRQTWWRGELIGALMLAALDTGVYIASTLAARPSSCLAPQITAPMLDCFWPSLGASLTHLPWVYVAISFAVPCAAGLLSAMDGGDMERSAKVGSLVGLLGSGFEILLIAGVIVYEFVTAAPNPPGCTAEARCVSLTGISDGVQLLLVMLGLIVATIALSRLLAGIAVGALGGWLALRLRRAGRAITRPTHP